MPSALTRSAREMAARRGSCSPEQQLRLGSEPTLHDVSEALHRRLRRTDYGIHNPTWISEIHHDMARQAAAYPQGTRPARGRRRARASPDDGGQGLNTGVQDAVNLGWKLAQVINGTSPPSLLDTYHAERHPIAARVLRNTMAAVALRRPDQRTKALGGYFSELLSMDEPRKRLAAEDLWSGHSTTTSAKDIRPLGRRMPDLDLVTANGPLRVFTLFGTMPGGADQL